VTTTLHATYTALMDASTADAPCVDQRDALLRMTPTERAADTTHRRATFIADNIDYERRDADLAGYLLNMQR
jgi:hypothetical protein